MEQASNCALAEGTQHLLEQKLLLDSIAYVQGHRHFKDSAYRRLLDEFVRGVRLDGPSASTSNANAETSNADDRTPEGGLGCPDEVDMSALLEARDLLEEHGSFDRDLQRLHRALRRLDGASPSRSSTDGQSSEDGCGLEGDEGYAQCPREGSLSRILSVAAPQSRSDTESRSSENGRAVTDLQLEQRRRIDQAIINALSCDSRAGTVASANVLLQEGQLSAGEDDAWLPTD
jgi:hypothetical protein